MSRQHQFINSAINIMACNRDGSHRTKNDRRVALLDNLKLLYASGYQLNHVRYIKQKHIRFMVAQWMESGLSTGTIKNRLSHFRWLMGKVGKSQVIPDNDKLGIRKRIYAKNVDRSTELTMGDLTKVSDSLMRLSLKGQQLFGLRVEESLKLQPHLADAGNALFIKGSWAKGGRERLIPIRTAAQRAWLEDCKRAIAEKNQSLIPNEVSYKTYRKRFEKRCERAGINRCHGLRHAYAQQRYRELTGFDCTRDR